MTYFIIWMSMGWFFIIGAWHKSYKYPEDSNDVSTWGMRIMSLICFSTAAIFMELTK